MACVALHAQLTVECEGGYLKRCSHQDDCHILFGIRQHRGRTAKPQRQCLERYQSYCGNSHARNNSINKACCSHRRSIIDATSSKFARHVATAAMTKEGAYRLNKAHQRKDDTYCCRRLCVELAYKIGIDNSVQTRNKHRDNRRYCHRKDDTRHWRLCKKLVIVSILCFHTVFKTPPQQERGG